MVLIGHALNLFFPGYFMVERTGGSLEARTGLLYVQNLGVTIFFLLSGFLITASAMRGIQRHEYGLAYFLADRFARIFTPLVPILLIVFVGDRVLLATIGGSAFSDVNAGVSDLALNMMMLAGNPALSFIASNAGLEWLSAPSFGSADQLWTVIVEWWIYVAFGIGFLWWNAKRPKGLATIAWLGLAAVATSVMAGTFLNYSGLLVAWAVGMTACIVRERIDAQSSMLKLIICTGAILLATIIMAARNWNLYDPLAVMLIGIAFYALYFHIDTFSSIRTSKIGMWVPIYMSNVSYSLYLIHLSVLIWLVAYMPQLQGNWWGMAIGFFAANIAAFVCYILFERHYRRVRRWLQPLVDRIGPQCKADANTQKAIR